MSGPQRDTTLRMAAMAEQTRTTTNQRPAIYRVATGNTLKGATVEILGTPDDKPLDAPKPNDKVLDASGRNLTARKQA